MSEIDEFKQRAQSIMHQYLDLTADFIDTCPLGSFVSKEQLNAACGDSRVELRVVAEHLENRNSGNAFRIANKDNRFIGLFIISGEAARAYNNYQVF